MRREGGSERPVLARDYFKAHGLGNDYLVFREGSVWRPAPDAVRSVCDRWTGLGSDGIVVLLGQAERPTAPFTLRMFNPDGSEFERSGNGLRILAAFLSERGWVEAERFVVRVGGDEVVMQVESHDDRGRVDVSVEMGPTLHGPEAIALEPSALDDRGRLDVGPAGFIEVHPVSVGNPHAVVFEPEVSEARLLEVGPALEKHVAIARGTNVQLAAVLDERTLEARIWERGVGVTAASGTSACAVAAAAVQSGRVPAGDLEIRMPGGSLRVAVDSDLNATLRGPVQIVAEGRLHPGLLG